MNPDQPNLFTDFYGAIFFQFTASPFWPIVKALSIAVIFLFIFIILFEILTTIRKQRRLFSAGNKRRSAQEMLQWLRTLDPNDFEQYIGELFKNLGYQAEVVGGRGRGDGGIDLIVTKNGVKHYVQCKRYATRTVRVGAVRDFYGAIANLLGGTSYFITTNKFTIEAERFAEDKEIETIDGLGLLKYIALAQKSGTGIKEIFSDKWVCPRCNGELVKRSSKYGDFLGCSNFPTCTYKENVLP